MLQEATDVKEVPGQGLQGVVKGRQVAITGRRAVPPDVAAAFSSAEAGLECIVLLDGAPEALIRFQDEARPESQAFV